MIVGHLGPAGARQGGPAGYLAQLQHAMTAGGGVRHTVLFPPASSDAPVSDGQLPPRQMPRRRLATSLRRARRTWLGAPRVFRPAASELRRIGGPAALHVDEVWTDTVGRARPSITQAFAAGADVLFAHDAPTADAALRSRRGSQQVWLMMHNPMPLALYLVWCWGVPEMAWEDVCALPDVQAGIERELAVLERVDRVIVPSAEAAGELIRVDARFGRALGKAAHLITGASGPSQDLPGHGVPELRMHFGLPEEVPVGVFVGNAQPYRGLDVLIEAVTHLATRAPVGVVAVAGCPRDRLPFSPRLRALGHVPDVADLLAAADFAVNVNRFSLFDLSIIEALEAGRPVLLSPVGGNRTFAALGAGAVMTDGLSPRAVADGLAHMFGQSAADRARLGARSRACYELHLTVHHLRDRHLALYDTAARARVAAHA